MDGSILIIDDEVSIRQLLSRLLSLEGYTVREADTARSAMRLLEQQEVDLVISDVRLPDRNGIDLTAQLKQLYPATEIIVLTAYGTIANGVTAIKNGAFDYITKGDDNDRIIPLVSRAIEKAQLQYRIRQLEAQMSRKYSFDQVLGSSPAIRQAVTLAQKVAATDTTVLLMGETGTGKEVFAQAIHGGSARRTGPFVAVNCGALSKDILESELFGHRAGAFTGATRDQKGLFSEAHKGTIFLDEIGELPLDLQAKLLRVLETHTFLRVGDTKPTEVDVRILAATNRNLEAESEAGRFRLDLFYRLSVFTILLPALRERPGDIAALAETFAQQIGLKLGHRTMQFSADFLPLLQRHSWKGNIRELRNVIERAVILAEVRSDAPTVLSPEHLPLDFREPLAVAGSGNLTLEALEHQHISRVLQLTNQQKTEAARLLGISLATLYRKLEEYGLKKG